MNSQTLTPELQSMLGKTEEDRAKPQLMRMASVHDGPRTKESLGGGIEHGSEEGKEVETEKDDGSQGAGDVRSKRRKVGKLTARYGKLTLLVVVVVYVIYVWSTGGEGQAIGADTLLLLLSQAAGGSWKKHGREVGKVRGSRLQAKNVSDILID